MLETNTPKVETENTMPRQPEARPTLEFARSQISMLSRRAAGDEEGGTAIEYALIASGVGAAVAATVYSLGTSTATLYQSVSNLF